MSYNWEKIFKGKSDKELYKIYIGHTNFTNGTKEYAIKELKARNFDFNNIDKQRKKWELEDLITKDKSSRKFSFFAENEYYFLIMGIFGIVFTVLNLLDIFLGVFDKATGDYNSLESIFYILVGLTFSIIGLIGFNRIKKRRKERKKKIQDLIQEI
jgi:uncharacterized membrane protein YuzA (DUF378 family)